MLPFLRPALTILILMLNLLAKGNMNVEDFHKYGPKPGSPTADDNGKKDQKFFAKQTNMFHT